MLINWITKPSDWNQYQNLSSNVLFACEKWPTVFTVHSFVKGKIEVPVRYDASPECEVELLLMLQHRKLSKFNIIYKHDYNTTKAKWHSPHDCKRKRMMQKKSNRKKWRQRSKSVRWWNKCAAENETQSHPCNQQMSKSTLQNTYTYLYKCNLYAMQCFLR